MRRTSVAFPRTFLGGVWALALTTVALVVWHRDLFGTRGGRIGLGTLTAAAVLAAAAVGRAAGVTSTATGPPPTAASARTRTAGSSCAVRGTRS